MKLFLLTMLFISAIQTAHAYSITQAKEDMAAGRYTATIENLRQLVDDSQTDYEAWFLLGVAHVHEQQYHQAIEAFRQVIALRPELAEPHNNLAAVYNNLGDTKAAVRELEAALEKRPNYPVAEENIADLYVKLALQHYRHTLQYAPNPVAEQRYARLIKVRDPIAADVSTESKTIVALPEQNKPATTLEEPPTEVSSKPTLTKAEPSSPSVQPAASEEISITGVLDALEHWRKAWASQDLDQYFSAYATDYKPEPRFGSQQAWKAYKTRVISNKSFIKLSFEQVEVDLQTDKKRASVMLLQRFRSNNYSGDDFKKITFKFSANGWEIIQEASVK